MTKRFSIASAVMTGFAALLALLLISNPAFAHHKDGHDKGGKPDSSTTEDSTTTEDNDKNDNDTPNNVADEGDNKHPSGKDRSVENGGSGNQGKSESDPDGDENGGPDKPGGAGGDDLADQDGNNGCGNDDDFEDDNNGNCGGKDKVKGQETKPEVAPTTPAPCPSPMTYPSSTGTCGETPETPDSVLGDETKNCPHSETMAASEKDCEEVLGSIIEADTDDKVLGAGVEADEDTAAAAAERPAGAALPFTGGNVVLFLVIALGLLGVGAALLRTRRS